MVMVKRDLVRSPGRVIDSPEVTQFVYTVLIIGISESLNELTGDMCNAGLIGR